MSLEAWSTAAAVASFAVITITAIAALIQLAHLRRSNQIQAVIELGNEFRAVAAQIGFVYAELPEKMKDPEFRRKIGVAINTNDHPELLACVFFEQMGMLVRWQLMDEHFIMDYAGGANRIVRCWTNLQDVIAIRRRSAPTVYQNFEYLASCAKKWLARFPDGNYPPGEERIPLTDRWADGPPA